jgi:leucyl-tRNA synthetase
MFVSSPEKQMEWSGEGVEGSFRVVNKLIRLKEKISSKSDKYQDNKINLCIKRATENIEKFDYPKAIISIVDCIDSFQENISKKNYEIILKLISPFCPHIAEELWGKLGNKKFISIQKWPVADEKKIDEKFELQEQALEKTVSDIQNVLKIVEEKQNKRVSKIFIYTIPNELGNYNEKALKKRLNKEIKIFAVNDKNKYDPENKAGKSKPGKPGIFVE